MNGKQFYERYKGKRVRQNFPTKRTGRVCGYHYFHNEAVAIALDESNPIGWSNASTRYEDGFIDGEANNGYWFCVVDSLVLLQFKFGR